MTAWLVSACSESAPSLASEATGGGSSDASHSSTGGATPAAHGGHSGTAGGDASGAGGTAGGNPATGGSKEAGSDATRWDAGEDADAARPQQASVCEGGSVATSPDFSQRPRRIGDVPPNDGYGSFNLEGPVWIDGALYLSEIRGGGGPPPSRILRYRPQAGVEVFLDDAGTNGLAVDAAGRLWGASHKLGAVVRFALDAPQAPPSVVAGEFANKRFSSPNDLAVREDGIVYFTDPAYQAGSERQDAERAYWVDGVGRVQAIEGAPEGPNGVALSPAGDIVYVGGRGPLVAFPLAADGTPGAAVTVGTSPYSGVDGLGIDCAGNVYVTLHDEGTVVVVTSRGERLGEFSVGSGVTNVAFGGASRSSLYITRLNPPSLYVIDDVGLAGLPY